MDGVSAEAEVKNDKSAEAAREYLEQNNITELLQAVITSLLIDRPDNHLDYLAECMLKAKELTLPYSWQQFIRSEIPLHRGNKIFEGKKVIFIFGGPGSGKGTQSEKIAKKYGIVHLSTGDMLRAELASGTDLGKNVKQLMNAGQLVPMDIVLTMLRDRMLSVVNDVNGYLIDGYPRELIQAEEFEKSICPCTMVIYLKASDETMIKRLLGRAPSSGRADDSDVSVIENRIAVYKNQTVPVLEYYKQQDKVFEIDSEKSIDEVFDQIEKVMDTLVE